MERARFSPVALALLTAPLLSTGHAQTSLDTLVVTATGREADRAETPQAIADEPLANGNF